MTSGPGRERERNWYDQDATMMLPVIAPEATVLLPSQAPSHPITFTPRHAAPEAGQTYPPDTRQMYPPEPGQAYPPEPGQPYAPPRGQIYQSQTYRNQAYAGQVYTGQAYAGRHAQADRTQQLPIGQPVTTPVEAPELTGSVARNSAVMAVGSIASRVTGFLRTAVLAAALGAHLVADDYNLANNLPNQVYELLMGGVLTSVIVPLLMRARTRDADRGEAYAQRLLSIATVFLGVTTLLAVAAAPLITAVYHSNATSHASSHLLTTLSYLLLPEIFFYGMAALLGAVLNTRGHFAAPMWTPILNNIVVIFTAGIFMLLPGPRAPTPDTITGTQVAVLGIGTTLGIVVQAAGLIPALRRVRFRWRWRWDWRELHLPELVRISAWMLLYVGVSQAALVVILKIANQALLDDSGAPGVTVFNNAYIVFVMAYGIVAVSITTALMPRMSTAAAERRHRDLAGLLSLGARLTAVLLIPITAAYLVLGRPLAVTLFNFGNYGQRSAVQTGWVIAAAGLGLMPFAISQMQLFAFYAMPDTKTPALINIPIAVARVILDILLYLILPASWVVAGLMVANAASYVLAAAIGNSLLRKRIGNLGFGRVVRTLVRLAVAATVAAIPTVLIALIIQHVVGGGKLGSLATLVIGSGVLGAVYLGVAFLLRVEEVNEVWGMVRRRVAR